MNFLPKDEKFFEYFHEQSAILCQASSLLVSGLQGGYQSMCQIAKRMEALERTGDEVTHRLFDRLRQTFITPFDPEDIQALGSALDNVLDTVEDATFRIVAYRIDPIPAPAVELGEMIASCCRALALEEKRSVMEDCIEVNRVATCLGLPVSTTHVLTGAIAGVGSIQRVMAVRWNVTSSIVIAWVLTIPAAALVSAVSYTLIRLFRPNA